MNTSQAGQGGLVGAVVLETVPPAPPPPSLTETYKFEHTWLGPLQIPRDIVSNITLNGYSSFADLAYFGHKDFGIFFSAKIRKSLNRGGANYSDKVGLVWREGLFKDLL